jgi:hypothetical protein
MYKLDQFVDDIANETTGKAVIIGPQEGGSFPVFFLNRDSEIEARKIAFHFAADVSRKHRNIKTGRKTLATFFMRRKLHVGLVDDPGRLGEAFIDYWPQLAQFEHPAHDTVQ